MANSFTSRTPWLSSLKAVVESVNLTPAVSHCCFCPLPFVSVAVNFFELLVPWKDNGVITNRLDAFPHLFFACWLYLKEPTHCYHIALQQCFPSFTCFVLRPFLVLSASLTALFHCVSVISGLMITFSTLLAVDECQRVLKGTLEPWLVNAISMYCSVCFLTQLMLGSPLLGCNSNSKGCNTAKAVIERKKKRRKASVFRLCSEVCMLFEKSHHGAPVPDISPWRPSPKSGSWGLFPIFI